MVLLSASQKEFTVQCHVVFQIKPNYFMSFIVCFIFKEVLNRLLSEEPNANIYIHICKVGSFVLY